MLSLLEKAAKYRLASLVLLPKQVELESLLSEKGTAAVFMLWLSAIRCRSREIVDLQRENRMEVERERVERFRNETRELPAFPGAISERIGPEGFGMSLPHAVDWWPLLVLFRARQDGRGRVRRRTPRARQDGRGGSATRSGWHLVTSQCRPRRSMARHLVDVPNPAPQFARVSPFTRVRRLRPGD